MWSLKMPNEKKKESPDIQQKMKRLTRFQYDETDLIQIFGENSLKNESKHKKKLVTPTKKSNK